MAISPFNHGTRVIQVGSEARSMEVADVSTMDAYLAIDKGMRGNADEALQLPIFAPAPYQFERWATVLGQRPDLQPELFGLGDGVAGRLDRSDAAGNGVVSLAAAYAWRTLEAAHCRDWI